MVSKVGFRGVQRPPRAAEDDATVKALVLEEYGRLVYRDAPDPEVGPKDVLVRVKACGICGSDAHGVDGSTGRRIPPLIMGHEAAGVVERVGEAVQDWRPGDRVTFDSTVYCGECWFCRRGRINLCDRREVLGVSPGEYRRHGAFAEYVVVPQHIVYALPEGLSFERAALVEPLSVAVHAASLLHVDLGASAVVVGCGVIGLLAVQALRVRGCGRLIAVDIDPAKLELARRLGATDALRADQGDAAARIVEMTGGRGADASIEAVGVDASQKLAIRCLRKGGECALVGNRAPTAELLFQHVVTREIAVYGSCASSGEYPACLDLLARGAVDADPLISACAPLSEGAEWFRRLAAGEEPLLKVILQP